ncbi:GEVED domain-containing protein [Lacinutrix sp. 5H-3-7-4]|uniref:beta strand repeat-containing protein n=1 Tax=Lacinutrix sp. (strain 5H-3-7-4) TaxID=983544 RepID=UPI00020A3468|nr:GEVED domain-containing protein [Lacinutrix sp. 5H-3-7-4]AEH00700.1 cell surface receptor IPT/TIG domain protein [Lacinutrix sp. 5H-3-7-4]
MKNAKLLLILIIFSLSYIGYGQVSENFDGWTDNSYGGISTYSGPSGNWETNNSICAPNNARTGNAIRFNDNSGENEYLLYSGLDGNGKDNGIGDISFWYRHWSGNASNVQFQVQYSNDGTNWNNAGGIVSATSTTYNQFTTTVNITGDDYFIRVISIDDAERLMIDDFLITDYTVAPSDLVISGTEDHGSSCIGVAATTIQYTITNNDTSVALGVAVNSNNSEYVISGLSSTNIIPSGTATFNVTYTPTTVGPSTATITVSSSTTTNATIDLTGSGVSVPTINTQPNNQLVTEPETASFSVTATNANSYQWQVSTNGGSTFTNVTTGTGGNTANYTTENTISTMDNYQYQCVVTNSCGSITSGTAILDVLPISEVILNSNNPATAASTIVQAEDNHVIYQFDLAVTAATSNAELTSVDFTTSGSYAASNITNFKLWYDTTSTFNASTSIFLENLTTGLGTGTHTFSGLNQTINTGSTGYFFITTDIPCTATAGNTIQVDALTIANLTFISANKSGTAYSSELHTFISATPNNVTGHFLSDCENGNTTVNWTDPAGCSDNILIFATDTSFSTLTPTGNGSAYTANTIFGNGTAFDGGFCIYKGTGNTETITGLTNGTNYTYKIFTRNDLLWSTGVIIDCTPNITYCDAGPTSTTDSEIENVILVGENNSISNDTSGICTGATGGEVSDFTAMSADLAAGSSYSLSVEFGDCNDGSQYSGAGGVWIDWNNDGDFNDTNETIGTLDVAVNTGNIIETFSINVPSGQTIGNYRMRIVQEEGGDLNSISPCGTFSWGAVEDYTIEVISACIATHSITSIYPSSGPVNTNVTVNGSNFSNLTTATFNGLTATIVSQTSTTLVITIPPGATTGNLEIFDDLSCSTATPFNIIESSGNCNSATNLMITEVFDNNGGSLGYIEIYNGTNTTIDLTEYRISRYGDLTNTVPTYSYNFPTTGVGSSIASGDVLVGKISSDAGGAEDFNFGGNGFNDNDRLELIHIATSTVIDDFHDSIVQSVGYVYRRNVNISNPNPNYDSAEWTTATSGSTSDLGNFSTTSTGVTPSITSQPNVTSTCDNATFAITAAAGNSGTLTYQWLYNDGTTTSWFNVTDAAFSSGVVTGETTNTLSISGFDLTNYQFYCLVTEDGACAIASNAARSNPMSTTWNGTWSNGVPNIATQAIINADYDTATNGSFSACSLIINNSGSGFTVTISNNTYIEVENNVVNNGEIIVQHSGSFVQNNDLSTFTNTATGLSRVTKLSAFANDWLEYTYWSSPVVNETIGNALSPADPNRRFRFRAENFEDNYAETNNTNPVINMQDDEDDNGNDWVLVSGTDVMNPGTGYAATLSTTSYNPPMAGAPLRVAHTFSGEFNNGIIPVTIYKNDNIVNDKNWNLVGNPYASAISIPDFFAENVYSTTNTTGTIDGVIYYWSHQNPPLSTNNGNSQNNFSQSDYVMINEMGGTIAGDHNGDGTIDANDTPDEFIPSGQGFYITYNHDAPGTASSISSLDTGASIVENTIVFNNAMRVTGNNSLFYKNASQPIETNKLWLNLTTDTGVFSQLLVGYKQGATNGLDPASFDAIRNRSTGNQTFFYSIIENSNLNYAIQGKAPESLTIDEVIPLGIYTSITNSATFTISISHFEGDFLNNNTIYLKDNYEGVIHDLSASNYNFTTTNGEFRDRFEVVFNANSLAVEAFSTNETNLTIVELQDDNVQFSLSGNSNLKIEAVRIIDVLGRELYNFRGSENTEVYNLSKLSTSTYIAQITLSNGKIIAKKAIKK